MRQSPAPTVSTTCTLGAAVLADSSCDESSEHEEPFAGQLRLQALHPLAPRLTTKVCKHDAVTGVSKAVFGVRMCCAELDMPRGLCYSSPWPGHSHHFARGRFEQVCIWARIRFCCAARQCWELKPCWALQQSCSASLHVAPLTGLTALRWRSHAT